MSDRHEMDLYTAVYSNTEAALADLEGIEQLHRDDLIGKYDAAVVDLKEGKPHIVKRIDRPRVRIIPEEFGGGNLPRNELKEAAEDLHGEEAGLLLVGEPTIEKAFDKAVGRANKVLKRDFDATADEIAQAMQDAAASA